MVKAKSKSKTPKAKKKRLLVMGMAVTLSVVELDEDGSVSSLPASTQPYFLPTKEWLEHGELFRKGLLKDIFDKVSEDGEVILTTTEK